MIGRAGRGHLRVWLGRVLLLAPAVLVVGVLFGGGLFEAGLQSLGYLPALGRTEFSLAAYRAAFADPAFVDSLWLTLYIAITATALATLLGIAGAIALRRLDSAGAAGIVAQIPIAVPHLVAAIGIGYLLSQAGFFARLAALAGWIDQPGDFPALVHDRYAVAIIATYVWKETPFIALLVLARLRGVSAALEQAAATLGAGPWQRLRYVVLPLIAPTALGGALVIFAFTFGAFEVPLLLGHTYPETLPVLAFHDYRSIDLGKRPVAMAITLIIAGITLLVAMGCFRFGAGFPRTRRA